LDRAEIQFSLRLSTDVSAKFVCDMNNTVRARVWVCEYVWVCVHVRENV
jgi:hypothetical protein